MHKKIKLTLISIIFNYCLANSYQPVDELVVNIFEKAKEIRSQNPSFDNRQLIKRFLDQYPEYLAAKINISIKKVVEPKKIIIIGGGPSGLIAAYGLARDGHSVTIYEKRTEEQFSLRWQNISLNVPFLIEKEFSELDILLKENKEIQYEMELDNLSIRSYRIAIGDLQNTLLAVCRKFNVKIHYSKKLNLEDISNGDIIILATGANTLKKEKNIELAKHFHY